MIMKKDTDVLWYFVLPTNMPGISNVMPKTDKEFQIWGSLITVFDKAVIDLTKEVKAGHIHSLEDLSHKAGEMALPPAMIVVLAFGELEQAKKKEAAVAKDPKSPAPTKTNSSGGQGAASEPKDPSKVPEVPPADLEKIKQGEKPPPPK